MRKLGVKIFLWGELPECRVLLPFAGKKRELVLFYSKLRKESFQRAPHEGSGKGGKGEGWQVCGEELSKTGSLVAHFPRMLTNCRNVQVPCMASQFLQLLSCLSGVCGHQDSKLTVTWAPLRDEGSLQTPQECFISSTPVMGLS